MSKEKDIDSNDKALFREAVGDVKRLNQSKVTITKARVPKRKTLSGSEESIPSISIDDPLSDEYIPNDISAGDELSFVRPGIQHSVFKNLRRGKIATEAELDLHGRTTVEARTELLQFLADCQRQKVRAVKIIHGKGHRSQDGRPVLKQKISHWLQQLPDVLAFCSARSDDGGLGAVYVLIKRAPDLK